LIKGKGKREKGEGEREKGRRGKGKRAKEVSGVKEVSQVKLS